MLGLTFSSKLDCGSYIISIAKTASKKIGALACSVKFLSPEVALYLYKSTIWPCMEYCCHAWAAAQLVATWNCWISFRNKYAGLILEGGLLVILRDYMIFLSPFLDVIRMSMSTVSFLEQLDYKILCL